MSLQGRELSQSMQGKDVLSFKTALALLDLLDATQVTEWDAFDASMAAAVVIFQQANLLPATGIIDEQTAKLIGIRLSGARQFAVVGTVTDASQQPVPSLLARAFYPRIGQQDEVLGESRLDERGNFVIFYTPPANRQADLLLRLYGANLNEIAASELHCRVSEIEEISFKLSLEQYRELSEYERHTKALKDALGKIPLSKLDDADLERLNCKTGIPLNQLRQLRLDAVHARQYKLKPGIYYGLLRQGLPSDFHRILQEKPSRWGTALKGSVTQNILPLYTPTEIDSFITRLQELSVEAAFANPVEGQPAGVGNIISTSSLSGDAQRAYVSFAISYEGPQTNFWSELAQQTKLSADEIREAQFTMQSAALTFNHLPELQAVQRLKLERGWTSPRELAQLTITDWEQIIAPNETRAVGAGGESGISAQAISRRVEATYPTATVMYRLLAGGDQASADLGIFFNANPEFDLLHRSVKDILADGAVLQNVSDPAALQEELETVQRIMRTVPEGGRGIGVPAVMETGYGSATSIANTTKYDFLGTMSPIIGEDLARDIWEGARHRFDAVSNVVMGVRDWLDSPRSEFMPHVTPEDDRATWVEMFGNISFCECKHCRSVYSPAAYLVDLLKYLRDAPRSSDTEGWVVFGGVTLFGGEEDPLHPLTALLKRRPDLEHILLNCENTNHVLPYIDLVNELLEDAVLRLQDNGSLQTTDAIPVPSRDVSDTELAAYREAIVPYQTTWSEARLRAEPEHERPEALALLSELSYPWLLPFDPNMERAWFFSDYLGLNLYQLWKLFDQHPRFLAMAFFRITINEWRFITIAENLGDKPSLLKFWGTDDWELLKSVPVFLKHSRLTYSELLEFTATSFLADSTGAPHLRIVPLTGTDPCDVENLRIQGLSPSLLDLIHRFLRLQRKLGWSVGLLDRTLVTFAGVRRPMAITANSILLILRLRLLAQVLHITVEGVLEFYQLPREQRIPRWSKAFRLTEMEFEWLQTVLSADPYTDPETALQMLEQYNALRKAGFNPGELRYVLMHQDQDPAAYAPHPEDLAEFLRTLHSFVPEYEAQRLGESAAALETATADLSEADQNAYIEALRQDFRNEAIVTNLAQFLSLETEMVKRLVQPVLDETGTISSGAILHAIDDSTLPAINDLDEFVNVPAGAADPDIASTAAYERASRLLIRLDKTARILRQLNIDLRELEVMHALRTENDFLDFNALPVSMELPTDDAPGHWVTSLMHMIVAKQLQKDLRRGDYDLFDLLQYALREGSYPEDSLTDESTYARLAEYTGWIPRDLILLQNTFDFSPEAYRNYATYGKLVEAHRLARASRVAIADLTSWGKSNWSTRPNLIERTARNLENCARSKHVSEEAWYKTLTPLMDQLREKKRDVLLAYLMHRAMYQDEESSLSKSLFPDTFAVYDYFLIDPEMGSCFLTSRIKQANASIQLFIQRLLMNLEQAKARASSEEEENYWRQWEWMKNYRVWEANRKVFLYPENWIEPELRDNKSPFFVDLENELLQSAATDDRIERSFFNYLEKVYEVAKLDIRSLHYENERNVLHMVGRTYSDPHVYFYRRREADQSWTPWERLNIEIEGNHLITWGHKGRLYIFWATMDETEFKENEDDPYPQRYVDIKLHWAEQNQGKWISSKTAKNEALRYYFGKDSFEPSDLLYRHGPEDIHFTIGTVDSVLSTYESIELVMFVTPKSWVEIEGDPPSRQSLDEVFPHSIAKYIFDPLDQKITLDKGFNEIAILPKPIGNRTDRRVATERIADSRFEAMELVRRIGVASSSGRTDLNIVFFAGDNRIPTKTILALPRILYDNIIDRREWEPEYQEIVTDGMFWKDPYSLSLPADYTLFKNVPDNSRLLFSPTQNRLIIDQPFVYKDKSRTYLIHHSLVEEYLPEYGYLPVRVKIDMLCHPYVRYFLEQTYVDGVKGLLAPPNSDLDRQRISEDEPTQFHSLFVLDDPPRYILSDPKETIAFELAQAYGLYNWELFFHIPLLIAVHLSKNQQFEKAQQWFHYIFDPTDTSDEDAPARYWKVKPFFDKLDEPAETIEELMGDLASGDADMEEQIYAWRNDPFNPHLIARMRNLAYMKNVMMKYLDNIIAWGDSLFQRDTMESINEATQLYILAAKLLGERPIQVEREDAAPETFARMKGRLDEFANVMVELESELPAMATVPRRPGTEAVPYLPFYFCLPPNEKLSWYWDTLADRLFKIRHCMNIEGQIRQLPLFEPPIDPALLVRARALGLDLRQALYEISSPNLPYYRYAYVYQKATAICSEVRSLGSLLLTALEKLDAETLVLLRSQHEQTLLADIRNIKLQQIKESREAISSLEATRRLSELRQDFYSSREFMNASEQASLTSQIIAQTFQSLGQITEMAAFSASLIPDTTVGFPSSGTTFGGTNIGNSLRSYASSFAFYASYYNFISNMTATMGSYQRRQEDWALQAGLAKLELEQIDRQITAAEIRLAIAEQDLINHDLQVEQSQEIEAFHRNKFTNRQLYSWMTSQVSALYYQSYQMAYDLAKKAERAAQFELSLDASEFDFVKFGHWDNLKQGLLAGEQLQHQLQRLDVAYHEQNQRRLELTKHISLAMLNPVALMQLKETGSCEVNLPEWLFDLDYPGHYQRRIKSLSLTIPCVTGPYTGLHCTFTLLSHDIRQTDMGEYAAGPVHYPSAQQSIATSSGQNDAGVFELNFRDERYLPFEGCGAISSWRLELSGKWQIRRSEIIGSSEGTDSSEIVNINLPQFDFDTISDVIFHINYTARHSDELRGQVLRIWNETISIAGENGLMRLFSLRHEFPTEWHRFLHGAESHRIEINMHQNRFPFFTQGRINLSEVFLFLKTAPDIDDSGLGIALNGERLILNEVCTIGGVRMPLPGNESLSTRTLGTWTLETTDIPADLQTDGFLDPKKIEDIYVVCRYQLA